MLGVVSGGETDEPEWMKDFRLKKEKRAEEEKRRKEREDQKKQSIPSWKREILVKRTQRTTSTPTQSDSTEADSHVVGALLEAKASLRKPSFGGGVRSPSREEYPATSPARHRNPSFSESSRCSSRQRHPSWASDGADTFVSDPSTTTTTTTTTTMCASGDPVLLSPGAPSPGAPSETSLLEDHAAATEPESAEFRPGIVASLLSKFSSMGEQPAKSRLLRAGSSGNVSLHQPQPLVNNRLRSLDNLLSGDDETPFHQQRAPLAKRLSSPIELEKTQISGRTKYSRAHSTTDNMTTSKAENQNDGGLTTTTTTTNVRNQNFQLSHQKPSGVMAHPSQVRLPSQGAPLRADHAIDALRNEKAPSADLEREERNKENVKSCGPRRPSLSNLNPEEMPAPKTVSTYRSMFESGVTSPPPSTTPPSGGSAGTLYKIRRSSSGTDFQQLHRRVSSPNTTKSPSPTPRCIVSPLKSPSPTPGSTASPILKSPSPTPKPTTPKSPSPTPTHVVGPLVSKAASSSSSPTLRSSAHSSPVNSAACDSPASSVAEEISPVRESLSRVEGVTTEESLTESPDNSPRKDKVAASPTVDTSGRVNVGAQAFGVKLRKASRHSPPDVTADVERPKRSSLRSPSPLDDFFSDASSSTVSSATERTSLDQDNSKTSPPNINDSPDRRRLARVNAGATPPRVSSTSLSQLRQLASGSDTYVRRDTDSTASSNSARINSVSSTGFGDYSISSSVFKSPSGIQLSPIDANTKEETLRCSVFHQCEDEDIVRDYEAVHGLPPTAGHEQFSAMTITCDVADMQTTIEDEIPTFPPPTMMGHNLSSYESSHLDDQEESSSTVVLLSVKAVEGRGRGTSVPDTEFDEEEKRIEFAEESIEKISETAVDSIVVNLSDESDDDNNDDDEDRDDVPSPSYESPSPVIVPREENRFLSSGNVPKKRPTISPRRNPPQTSKPQQQQQQQQQRPRPDSPLSSLDNGHPDYVVAREVDEIAVDDAVIPCTIIDEAKETAIGGDDNNPNGKRFTNHPSKMSNGNDDDDYDDDGSNEINDRLRSLKPTAKRDCYTNGNPHRNNHSSASEAKERRPASPPSPPSSSTVISSSTSTTPSEAPLWQKPLMRHKIDQGGKLGESFNIGDLRKAVGTGSSTFFRSKKRPSENGNVEKANGVDSDSAPNGHDEPDNSESSALEKAAGDVRFIGEGVLVGKSALKSGNGKKLKISFDENAICYEYPSEQVAARNWELEHGPETSVSSATLNFLTEDDSRGETSDDVDDDNEDDDDDEDKNRKFLRNSTAVSGLTASGLGAYMPKYSPDYSSMDDLLTATDGFGGGAFAGEPERVVRRPPSPPMRHRGAGGIFDDEEEEDDDLSIRPMDGGNGWSSSTVEADILF